jgi:hypothetical protein
MAVAPVHGSVATDLINQAAVVPDFQPDITRLEPDAAPLTVLLKRLRKRKINAPEAQWLESGPLPRFSTFSAVATNVATTINVNNALGFLRAGDFIRNTATGEGIELTATPATGANVTVTVIRGIGGVAAQAIASGEELFVVANVNAEGACLREIRTPPIENKSNFAEIVRDPFGITGTMAATMTRGQWRNERSRLQAEMGIEHLRKWEQILVAGAKRQDLSTAGKPKRFAGGLSEFITTNYTAINGALTETAFLAWLRTAFRFGSSRKVLYASPLVVNAIEGFARQNIRVVNDRASTYGITMRQYVSAQGQVDILMSRWMQDSVNLRGRAYLLDIDNLAYAHLRDTKLLQDRQANDCDRFEDEYFTEATYIIAQERSHAILDKVTG